MAAFSAHDVSIGVDEPATHKPLAAPVYPEESVAFGPPPRAVWENIPLREAPASPISLADSQEDVALAQVEGARAEAQDATFVVFDVYHHARILPCKTWHTAVQLFDIAKRHTPEIASDVARFRVVRHLLPGFPPSQIVLWGDILPSAVVVLVAFRPTTDAICTVETLGSSSALQLVALVCRYCLIPDGLLDLVSKLDVQVVINGDAVFLLDPGTSANADTVQLRRSAFRQLLPITSAGSVSQGSSSSDAPARELARTITYDEDRPESFVIFAPFAEPLVMPIPRGSSVADDPLQVGLPCKYASGERSVQGSVWFSLSLTTPYPVSSHSGCMGHTRLSRLPDWPLADRRAHLLVDGRPCQPHDPLDPADIPRSEIIRVGRGHNGGNSAEVGAASPTIHPVCTDPRNLRQGI